MRTSHQADSGGPWDPDLVEALLDQALAAPGSPPVFGITGLQGSGKSTLAAQLAERARRRGLAVVLLSIDDVYLDRDDRAELARRVHPLLATRGPAGTHDLPLALDTLDRLTALRPGDSVQVPRFDKLGDRRRPRQAWPVVTRRPDLIVFEGWFLKTPPEAPEALAEPLNALERDEDPDAGWRSYCNRALAGYAPLWARIDRLLFLQPPGFESVLRWRGEQERALAAAEPERGGGMDATQLARFVQHYERISRQALRTLPAIAERTLPLDAERRPL